MSKRPRIVGTFRITHMDEWDQDYVDAEIAAFILIDRNGRGEFHFGHVSGSMYCEQTERDGQPAVEFSFVGHDEMDPISGRGWAILREGGMLEGKFFIHDGESSGFKARLDVEPPARPKSGAKSKRMVRVKDAETGEESNVEFDKLKPGRIRQTSLPDALLERIRAIHQALKGIMNQPLEQMELNFMRDLHPEREVAVWEKIVAALARVRAALPKEDPKFVLKTLVGHSMGVLNKQERSNPAVAKIIRIVEGK